MVMLQIRKTCSELNGVDANASKYFVEEECVASIKERLCVTDTVCCKCQDYKHEPDNCVCPLPNLAHAILGGESAAESGRVINIDIAAPLHDGNHAVIGRRCLAISAEGNTQPHKEQERVPYRTEDGRTPADRWIAGNK